MATVGTLSRPHSPMKAYNNGSRNGSPANKSKNKQALYSAIRKNIAKNKEDADGNQTRPDEEVDDDDDKVEGTSASGAAALMAKLGAPMSAKYFDIASLLKEPLVFLPAKVAEDSSQRIPYEPLPSGPGSLKTTNANGMPSKASATSATATDTNGISPSALDKGKSTVLSPTATPNSTSSVLTPLSWNWPQSYPVGPGYHNLGNTCFLNSTLQALTHTAPLVACLMNDTHHSSATCRYAQNNKFCLLCAMQRHIRSCFRNGRSFGAIQPNAIVNKLPAIARNMRVGRQEDAHEFLRFSLDSMQQSAALNLVINGKRNVKPVSQLSEDERQSTIINRIFGGKLRSRVTCLSCHHNSDTFDNFMDLSLDVATAYNLKDALKDFIKIDELKGANKYKCEKCKKLVNARKQFTINQAPQILHVHLKRFTPTGKKISGQINYPEMLQLGDYMSEDSPDRNPAYRLYAVVCHSGSGPHSGHYFAHVRSGNNKWHCMNDSSVSDVTVQSAIGQRNAYLLFYERCNRLGEVVGKIKFPASAAQPSGPGGVSPSLVANASIAQAVAEGASNSSSHELLGKRKDRDEESSERDSSPHKTPFSAQRVKLSSASAATSPSVPFKSPSKHAPLPQHRSSPYPASIKHASSSPNRFHSGKKGGAPAIKTNNFFSSHGNRPRVVSLMKSKPR